MIHTLSIHTHPDHPPPLPPNTAPIARAWCKYRAPTPFAPRNTPTTAEWTPHAPNDASSGTVLAPRPGSVWACRNCPR